MDKATSILLDDESEAFIGRQIADGHFNNLTEVIEAELQLLREHDEEIEAIRAALIEGEESEIAEKFDSEQFLQKMRSRHAAE